MMANGANLKIDIPAGIGEDASGNGFPRAFLPTTSESVLFARKPGPLDSSI